MSSGQVRLVTFVATTSLMATGIVAWALPRAPLSTAIVLVCAVFVGEWYSTRLRESVYVSLTNILALVAVILGGPALAVVAMIGAVPAFVRKVTDMRLVRISFNSGQYIIAALAGGLAYQAVTSLTGSTFPEVRSLLAVLLAAVTHTLVNHLMVAGVVSVSSTERFLDVFRTIGPSILMQVPYAGIAVLAAVVVQSASVWALLLLILPLVIARQSLLGFQKVDDSYDHLVRTFVDTIEMKDHYTRGHSERVAELSVAVAEELGVSYEERRLTRYAALLHDVGKVGIPLCVINKPGRLDDDEFEQMKQHPAIGADILRDIDFLEPALDIVRFHHERLDGRGYPYGMSNDELSRIVRVVTVADAFDAMTSTRPYRRAMSVVEAVAELQRCTGDQFDAEAVDALEQAVARLGWSLTERNDLATEVSEIALGTAEERIERASSGRPARTAGRGEIGRDRLGGRS
ncbi:MAG: HD-GYP domain-containing protein [Nitriliruptoraceae bacterium]|nr:HD-GYP domain-containing protein [Nitriliruptoraceae bacterium]